MALLWPPLQGVSVAVTCRPGGEEWPASALLSLLRAGKQSTWTAESTVFRALSQEPQLFRKGVML